MKTNGAPRNGPIQVMRDITDKAGSMHALAKARERRLFTANSPLLATPVLRSPLGHRSPAALRQAVARSRTPIHLFRLPGRRGLVAHGGVVAQWLPESGVPTEIGLDRGTRPDH